MCSYRLDVFTFRIKDYFLPPIPKPRIIGIDPLLLKVTRTHRCSVFSFFISFPPSFLFSHLRSFPFLILSISIFIFSSCLHTFMLSHPSFLSICLHFPPFFPPCFSLPFFFPPFFFSLFSLQSFLLPSFVILLCPPFHLSLCLRSLPSFLSLSSSSPSLPPSEGELGRNQPSLQ